MALMISQEKGCQRRVGQVASGQTIVANTFIKRSTTGWVPAGDGDVAGAIAVEGGTSLTDFQFTDEDGLVIEVTGALAVGAAAYLASASSVDGGAQGQIPQGTVEYWDTPKTGFNRVVCHFDHNIIAAHA
jgi:hypothetical protein